MRKNRLRLKTKIIAVIIVLVVAFVVVEANFSEVISNAIYYRATLTVSEIIESSIAQELEKENFTNADIIKINYNSENNVSSIEIQNDKLNLVRNNVSVTIIEKLKLLTTQEVDIPLSALIGSNFFFANFPILSFSINPTGYLETKVISAFEDSGINQTIHKIFIEVKVSFYCIFPFYDIKNDVDVQYILSETVVVGDVPENYTQVVTQDSELVADLYDFAIE